MIYNEFLAVTFRILHSLQEDINYLCCLFYIFLIHDLLFFYSEQPVIIEVPLSNLSILLRNHHEPVSKNKTGKQMEIFTSTLFFHNV
jgi:hypothetical protein